MTRRVIINTNQLISQTKILEEKKCKAVFISINHILTKNGQIFISDNDMFIRPGNAILLDEIDGVRYLCVIVPDTFISSNKFLLPRDKPEDCDYVWVQPTSNLFHNEDNKVFFRKILLSGVISVQPDSSYCVIS